MSRPSVRRRIRAVRRRPVVASLVEAYGSLRHLRHRDLRLLAGANVLDVMSVSLLVPLLPTYAAEVGAGPALLGVIFAAPAVTRALLSPFAGALADRLDRRSLVWTGTVLGALSVVALGVVRDPLWFVALRGLDGAANAMKGPATNAYVGDAVSTDERGSAMGAYRTAGMVGLAAGPAVGGAIAVVAGLAAPFFVLGLGTLAAGLVLAVSLRPVHGGAGRGADTTPTPDLDLATVRELATVPVVALVASNVLGQVGTGAMSPLFAPLLARTVGAGPGYAGLAWSAFGLSMLAFMPVGGSAADRRGRKPLLVGGSLAWSAVAVGLAVASAPVLPPLLMFVGGLASAFSGPALGALQYETAPDGHEGATLGVFSASHAVGMAIGPIAGGALAAAVGAEAVFLVIGLLWALKAGIVWVGVRETGGTTVS